MANALARTVELMFEKFIEGFDANCVVSREADTSYPSPKEMQRAGDTFYKRQNFHASVVTGLDISAATAMDVVDRFVPTVYRSPDNVYWKLDAKEMRDPIYMEKVGAAASQRLAAEIDTNIYTTVANQASIVIKKVGAFAWSDAARARSLMVSRGISQGDTKFFMNTFDRLDVQTDLGNRAYIGDLSKSAYERAEVPGISGFRSFETDNLVNLTAVGTVTGTTVNGNQSFTPSAMTGDVPTDNRRMTLSIAGANIANIKNGDAFTIANCNAVHMITKSDTGQPLTFRVISGGGTASLVITPAIVITGPYQNCTTQAAAGAAITFLNTATKPVNVFWSQGAVTLDYGKLAFPNDEGAKVMTASTKNGVPLLMSYAFNHLTGITSCRFTTLYATSVLDPEKCGIIIANQT